MASNTVIVRVLGNVSSLSRSLKKAQVDLAGLDRINNSIGSGFRTAAIGAAVFGAAAVGAGAAGALALAAIPAAILGIGIAFAAMNPKVKEAFSNLKTNVVGQMQNMTKAFVPVLVKGAGQIQKAFNVIAPALKKVFNQAAPLLAQAFAGLQPIAKQIGPIITQAFKAGVPVIKAFGASVLPITKGIKGFFRELGKGSPQFAAFVTTLGQSLRQLLPAIGTLLTALAPIGTVILSVLVPALVSLLNTISGGIGPAFSALTGVIQNHPTLFRNIGIAILVFVGAMKAAQLAVALFNGVMLVVRGAVMAFQGVMLAVRGATIAWTAVQWLLNAALTANPIGLLVVAIAALVAAFIIAYKKSDTFRAIVNATFSAIKNFVVNAVTTVVNFVKSHWKLLLAILGGPIVAAAILIISNWNRIKSATSAVWNAIKNVVTNVARGIANVVRATFNAIKSVASNVWNAIKSVTSSVWNGIKSVVTGAARAVASAVRSGFNAAKAAVTSAWNAAKASTVAIWNGIKSAVTGAINGLMSIVSGIKGRITGAFSGAAGWLLGAGKDIIQGLLSGIESMIGAVESKLSAVTDKIPDWKGPKEKDKKLLRPTGRWIMESLIKGFDDGKAGIKNTLGKVTTVIEAYFKKHGKSAKEAAAATNRVMRSLKNEANALMKNAAARQRLNRRLEQGQKKLADLRKAAKDYAADVKNTVIDFGSVTNLNTAFNADAMVQQLQARLEKVRQFTRLITDLKKKGLNKTAIDQLVQAGVEGGLATAQALANGGRAAIAQVNDLQAQIAKAGGNLGSVAADSMFKSGLQAAAGLVKGLQSKKKQLEKVAKNLGEAMVKAIKKALGIHSPSRVFAEVGRQTLAGIQVGLNDLNGVKRAMVNVGNAMVNSFDQPRLLATAGAGTNGGNTYNINVTAPSTVDKAALGREITSAIDAYERQGGRRRA